MNKFLSYRLKNFRIWREYVLSQGIEPISEETWLNDPSQIKAAKVETLEDYLKFISEKPTKKNIKYYASSFPEFF